jgi:anaerobic selenocysteine-containing dehydrogenase
MGRLTRCARDCPDSCILEVENTPDGLVFGAYSGHEPTMGFICGKTRKFPSHLSSPHRIREPWIKRSGHFHPASQEEALDEAARKIAIAAQKDPASILLIKGYASMGASKGFASYLFEKIGARTTSGSLCDSAGIKAIVDDAGELLMNHPAEIENARHIVLWGKNPASSNHAAARVERASKKGTRVIAVTVDGKSVSGLAHETILLRPGSDRFLALAVAKIMLENCPSLTPWRKASNGGEFLNFIRSLETERLLKACGVSPSNAEKLADFYGAERKTATLCAWGLQRHRSGYESVRAIHGLAFLADTLGKSGGGFYYNVSSSRYLRRPSGRSSHEPEPVFIPYLADELRRIKPEVIYVCSMNPVNQCPDSKGVHAAFEASGTVIVADAFWTETARVADIVLPVALWPEENDLAGSSSLSEIAAVSKVAEPPEGCLTDFEIMQELAKRIGVDTIFDSLDRWLSSCLPQNGPTLSELRQKVFHEFSEPQVVFCDGFSHPDGKFRLLTSLTPEPAVDPQHPLSLLSHVRPDAVHSQLLPEEQKDPLPVRIHPDTARKFGLAMGDMARIVSPVGEIECEVHLDTGLHPECVAVPRGGWMSLGRCANEVTEIISTDKGGCAAFYDTRVRLEPAERKERG